MPTKAKTESGIAWHIEQRTIADLKSYEHNPRVLTKKGLADLKRSVDKFGLAEPIVINTDGTIIGGHGRAKVLDRHGTDYRDIWHVQRKVGKNEDHATAKPIELCSKPIVHASKQGDIVLDLFGGSGSTLIACEQLGRKCYMMELDPRYCDVIVKRWEQFTGEKAILHGN